MIVEYTETVCSVNRHYTNLGVHPAHRPGENAGMEFCANMKRLREEQGLTQGQLSEQVGVAQATIQRWESGTREPSHADLEKLAQALDVAVSDLFADRDVLPNAEALEQMIQAAMSELPVGVSFSDYPSAVVSGLHARLRQFRAAGGFARNAAEGSAPASGVRFPNTTKPTAEA